MSQRNPYEVRRINEILEIMVDVLNSKAKTIRISGEDKPAEVVKAQFMKLDSSHMEYILDFFKNQTSDIHNIKQYLLTTIYNAPLTIDHYYTAKVSYDTDHVYHYDSQNHIFELADKYEERQHEAEHDTADKDSVLGDLKEKKQEIAKKDPSKDAATKTATKKHETSL